jgi:branched-chain amino acid transport system permease protein
MQSAVIVLLDGLAYGMVLFIISVGLTVTMGLMRVVNLAHGSFAMAGGYIAAVLVGSGVPFLGALIAGTVAAGILGGFTEITIFRRIYRKGELAQVLMTFGMVFVTIAALTWLFGTDIKRLPVPDALSGLVDLGFRSYPTYRLFLIGVGAVLAVVLWFIIENSLYGARLRAAVDNPSMARAVGIDVNRLFTITFVGGCALAGFGGIIGADMLPLEPFYALRYLVPFLVIVAVGGLGSFKGSFVAAITLGIIDTAGKFLWPNVAPYLFFGLVFLLLLWRPNGIIPPKSAA